MTVKDIRTSRVPAGVMQGMKRTVALLTLATVKAGDIYVYGPNEWEMLERDPARPGWRCRVIERHSESLLPVGYTSFMADDYFKGAARFVRAASPFFGIDRSTQPSLLPRTVEAAAQPFIKQIIQHAATRIIENGPGIKDKNLPPAHVPYICAVSDWDLLPDV